ncbi:MAG: GIY-YIG nuclease family protein [Candidatus Cloacimonetes bacterium]|nr:GIY-YIG nuclease family protein [Candidatus Cloacimonadota bacterium]
MKEKIIGVYQIINLINDKTYIGSSIDVKNRWREHKTDLEKNRHHSIYLQRSWNKYGKANFVFSMLEECDRNELLDREQYYLDKFKSYKKENGYNIAKNTSAPMMGRKHSKETLVKLSEGVRNRDSSVWVRGEDKFNAKFKDEDIINIKKLIYENYKIKDIAKIYNVKPNTITQIKTGERWNHIKTKYDELIVQTPKQKLTIEKVIEIKKLLIEENLTIVEIADMFDVTFSMISAIKNLKNWKTIGEKYNEKLKNKLIVCKLNKNMVKEIKLLLLKGKSCKEISQIYNVHLSTISCIKTNKTWKDVVLTEKDLEKIS